jgi:tRNA(fMet)-specific endonuclease VapC
MATRERMKNHLDKPIAAHAVTLDAVLVTNNAGICQLSRLGA